MLVSKSVIPSENNKSDISLEWADSLPMLIHTSLFTKRKSDKYSGDFFWDADFGSLLYTLKKPTAENLDLAKLYAQDALNWLVRVKKAKTISVSAKYDEINSSILLLTVSIEKNNGKSIVQELRYDIV